MRLETPFFSVPEWALEDLARVGKRLADGLPSALRLLLEDGGEEAFPPGGGDPLRPLLVLLVARSLGCCGERVVRLAAAVQMIHLASLLHDRLGGSPEDPSSGRGRGKDPHQQEAMDILLGDFLFSTASCIIIEDGDERIVRDMIETSIASAEAQADLVSLQRDPGAFGPSRCFGVVAEKLSLLLSLCLRVGAVLGNAPDAEREALSDFGALFGRALRIVRDLECWGRGDDAPPSLCGPVRYHHPLLLLWEREGKDAWQDAVRDLPDAGGRPSEEVRSRLEASGDLHASRRWARGYAEEALLRLERAPTLRGTGDLKVLVRDLLVRGEGRVGKGVPLCVP